MWYMQRQPEKRPDHGKLLDRCLRAFIGAGTLDLSLDQLARQVGVSKRMLIHYFGGRENIEQSAMARLEDALRAQFAPEAFPAGVSARTIVTALWERTTAPESKGVLLLVMDLSRRAWSGSARARAFYEEQQRLWVELLLKFIPDRRMVEEILQLFQGATLAYLITGDPEPGRRSLMRTLSRQRERQTRRGR
jgi:AcrR family transcriptional regulator